MEKENSDNTHSMPVGSSFEGYPWLDHRDYYFSYGFCAGGILDIIKIATGQTTRELVLAGYSRAIMFGCVGLIYGGLEKGIYLSRRTNLRDDDVFNSSLAGCATGAIYKFYCGPKAASIAAAIGGLAAAGIATYNKSSKLKSYK